MERDPKRFLRQHVRITYQLVIKVTECVCDKVSMPANGGTTCRFMRPRALTPPTVQLGNAGIDPPAQVPQRDIIDAQMAYQLGHVKSSLIDLNVAA